MHFHRVLISGSPYIYVRDLGTSTRRHCSLLVELRAWQRSFALFLEYTRYEVPCTEARGAIPGLACFSSQLVRTNRETHRVGYVESRLNFVRDETRPGCTVNCIIVKFREISVAINNGWSYLFRRFSDDKTEKIFYTNCLNLYWLINSFFFSFFFFCEDWW